MLSPKKVLHRKQQRRIKRHLGGVASRMNKISFGEYGLKALTPNFVTNRQIEAARIAINRRIKRGGKIWIRIFPDVPQTKKPAETRMGKGKGSPEQWVAAVKAGTVMFELAGVNTELAKEAMVRASAKLPLKAVFIERRTY